MEVPFSSIAATLYLAVGAICFSALAVTLIKHPLFPFRMSDLAWCRAWLLATVVDYYGAALPLCGVMVATAPSMAEGLAWSAGVLVLGSPVACAWAARRLISTGSLA